MELLDRAVKYIQQHYFLATLLLIGLSIVAGVYLNNISQSMTGTYNLLALIIFDTFALLTIILGTALIVLLLKRLFKGSNYKSSKLYAYSLIASSALLLIGSLIGLIPGSTCISAQDTWNHFGSYTCVRFYDAHPYVSSRGNIFLDQYDNYKSGFSVYIPNGSSLSNNDTVSKYGSKWIDVTGTIDSYYGRPEIIATGSNQVSLTPE